MDANTPHRSQFSTTDPDEAQDFINRMYAARPPKAGRLDKTSPVAISQVSAGGLSYVDFTMPPDLTLHLDGTDDLAVTTLLAGATHAELGPNIERYRPGDSFLGSFPQGDYLVRCYDFRAGILTVPASALDQVTASLPDQPRRPLRFASLRPVSPAAAAQWQRAAQYTRTLLEDDLSAASPLIIGSAARLLAATALAVFPNSVLADPTIADSRDAHPETLRRAVAFIDENAHRDISVADIAGAAFVTARAVQLAFRRHLNMTPLDHLRHVRLARAHADLLAADPATTTVGQIAARWGFPSHSRFTAAYQRTYGVTPSTTLRQR
ncbi:helix-turn-helix transcriptional regulator [Paractinoplanes lichenicola]|uniref:Helix-turn-helix transcriptional regulator n=1 Tax=Paractinoplanes lichenicola TaxID=2802976 RepID=A0ABS1VMR2_9ACTN|nr:helix-turn-helix transcriptional regulator [Actinoplanes lichenicola]MBL7256022.1 helix-turn-helix transcriptional regulator [Actinoplanes lichenicola]